MNYKIGQLVRVKQIKENDKYGHYYVTDGMARMSGKTFKVSQGADDEGTIKLDCKYSGYCWAPHWVEPVSILLKRKSL